MTRSSDIDETTATPSEAELLLVDLLYGDLDDDRRAVAEQTVRADDALNAEFEALSEIRTLLRSLPDEEPPQAVSAKLLHAAAAEAPSPRATASAAADEESGLWARLRGLFRPVFAYPGLAAAASLAVVLGVAAVLYSTGDEVVSHDVATARGPTPTAASKSDSERAPTAPVPDMAAAVEEPPAEPEFDGDEAGGDRAQPTDEPRFADQLDNTKTEQPRRQRTRGDRTAVTLDDVQDAPVIRVPEGTVSGRGGVAGGATAVTGESETVLELRTETPKLKKMPKDAKKSAGSEKPETADPAPAAPPARRAEPPTAKQRPAESAPAPTKPRPKPARDKARGNVRSLHDEAVTAARNGQCGVVSEIADRIRKLDKAYFEAKFSSDRRLSACRTSGLQAK